MIGMYAEPTYRYLNIWHASRDAWPGFVLDGLTIVDGELRLASVPAPVGVVGPPFDAAPGLNGPVGIGVDRDGTLYVANPLNHQILCIDPCDETSAPLACLRGRGREPGQLDIPRGVLVGPRRSLYIADSGNHRVQVVDLGTGQVRDIWGQPDPWGVPTPSADPGRFRAPWDIAADSHGHVYVADPGEPDVAGVWTGGRVQKFDSDGRLDTTFQRVMDATADRPGAPGSIAIAITEAGERLLVLDLQPARLLVYTLAGELDPEETDRWQLVAARLQQPAGLVVDQQYLYVADAGSRRLLVFDRQGTFVGATPLAPTGVAGLALDRQGRLLVHPGSGGAIQRLQPGVGSVESGTFLAGPFDAGALSTGWHRLTVEAGPLSEAAHIQLFTLTAATDTAVPSPWPSPAPPWRAAPRDGLDTLILNDPERFLWIAGTLSGDGTATPVIRQMRIARDHEGWLRYIPAIYRRDDASRNFLDRALALFESMLGDDERLIDDLPRLFDALGAPDDLDSDSWLVWLSGWLDVDLDERWDERKRRRVVQDAFHAHGRRGTRESLRDWIELSIDALAHISEPSRHASIWTLDDQHSVLGFSTMLAAAEAQGAVLDTTATVSNSHLIDADEFGAPLFDALAHRFCVRLYAAEVSDSTALSEVRRVIDREKPAHTTYHLSLIEPDLRIGLQSTIGVDTIVGQRTSGTLLADEGRLGFDTILPDSSASSHAAGTLGETARIGMSTRLV